LDPCPKRPIPLRGSGLGTKLGVRNEYAAAAPGVGLMPRLGTPTMVTTSEARGAGLGEAGGNE